MLPGDYYTALALYKVVMIAYLYGAEHEVLVSHQACFYVCSILCFGEGPPLAGVSVLSADIRYSQASWKPRQLDCT